MYRRRTRRHPRKNKHLPVKYAMIRPVKCYLCGRRMFYDGDERFEPERQFRKCGSLDEKYMHLRCLRKARKLIRR